MEDSELADLRKECITSLYLCTDNVSKYLDEEKEAEFEKLKSYVEEYCLLEAHQEVAIQALERTKKDMEGGNIDLLEQTFKSHLDSMAERQLNVAKHPYMLEFKNRIKKGNEMARQNLDESDLVVTETNEQFIDPITKTQIEDPVKNSICGHIYEKHSILKLIQMKKKKTLCPVVGCGNRNPVTKDHLLCDEELRFRMTLTQHSTMVQEHTILNLNDSNQSFRN